MRFTMKKTWAVISLLCIAAAVGGCTKSEPTELPSAEFIQSTQIIVDQLIKTSFPELAQANITVKGISSNRVFLATDIIPSSLFQEQRQYVLYLNPHLEQQPMSEFALTGILAHELTHFTDYTKMSVADLAIFLTKIKTSSEFNASYERATDLQSFERGYAAGIKEFRLWLYQQISDEAKRLKMRNYYTPVEIDQWLTKQL